MSASHERGPKDRFRDHINAASDVFDTEVDKLRARVHELELENTRLRIDALQRVYDEARRPLRPYHGCGCPSCRHEG